MSFAGSAAGAVVAAAGAESAARALDDRASATAVATSARAGVKLCTANDLARFVRS
jgi:hypothetical protein